MVHRSRLGLGTPRAVFIAGAGSNLRGMSRRSMLASVAVYDRLEVDVRAKDDVKSFQSTLQSRVKMNCDHAGWQRYYSPRVAMR